MYIVIYYSVILALSLSYIINIIRRVCIRILYTRYVYKLSLYLYIYIQNRFFYKKYLIYCYCSYSRLWLCGGDIMSMIYIIICSYII